MKAPYHVLFSNDTTNIVSCKSPYSPERTFRYVPKEDSPTAPDEREWIYKSPPFTAEMLEASVDETAGMGVDVHLLQPGLGWVPWWKSKIYPFEEHIRFMKEQTGKEPWENGFATYMAKGGDMVDVFVKRCREVGLSPFVSLRLNDSHGHEFTSMDPKEIPSWAWHVFSPTHVEHPEWRLGEDIRNWNDRVLNWAIPEVRAFKFAFIQEIIENYDIDGFELDFMRHFNFFRQAETSSVQRRTIITQFVRDVRAVLDRTSRPGQHRWLCVRIPAQVACHDPLGIDPGAMAGAGVDMFNLSHSYYTQQQAEVAAVRELVGDASIYVEMCHCTYQHDPEVMPPPDQRYDYRIQRRTTPRQFYTTAHLAYARGADGVSTFNFVYYREHGVGERGPTSEPPFFVLQHLGDRGWLAQQPQHYILAEGWGSMGMVGRQMPRVCEPGQSEKFALDMAPPAGGWKAGGRFRVQAEGDLGESQWQAVLNGVELEETGDTSEPYENPYPQLLGMPEQHRAWVVPAQLLKDGINEVEVTMVDAAGQAGARLVFLDFALQ